jgi:hypothetical protein
MFLDIWANCGRLPDPHGEEFARETATNKGSYCLWGNWTVIPENQLLQFFNILYTLAETRLNSSFYIA